MSQNTLILFKKVSIPYLLSYLILLSLFFFSGCASLIYQVMWERMLFSFFGTDLQSITIIVSVFMFGLSVGGFLGGYLANYLPNHLLLTYIFFELIIAGFGFLSPWLITFVGNYFFTDAYIVLAIITFLLLAFPTLLMGATFPILVKQVNTKKQNVGESVGALYMVNTLGGAIGAYFAGFVLLYSLTLVGSIYSAACLNLSIAIIGGVFFKERN